jgi:hypothetical protein
MRSLSIAMSVGRGFAATRSASASSNSLIMHIVKRPWPSGNIVEWIEDAKKVRPLPHIEIILNNVQSKRKRWQMNRAKAETRHDEHETANYTAQSSDQPEKPTRHARRNKNLPPYYTKRTLDAATQALDTPRSPNTENEAQQNRHTTGQTITGIPR